MSDVPLGAFLSGGIDSSAIAALASARKTTPRDTAAIRRDELALAQSKKALDRDRTHGFTVDEERVAEIEAAQEIVFG